MMTVEKMAKVVSEINRGLASSRPQGVESPNQLQIQLRFRCVFVCVFGPVLDTNRDTGSAAAMGKLVLALCMNL